MMQSPLFRAVVRVDTVAGEVELPVFRGEAEGHDVWYIITESSDAVEALKHGVTFAPRLARLHGTRALQRGHVAGSVLHYAAGVEFSPSRVVRAQPDSGFPALEAHPGSVAHDGYSPFIEVADGVILNAPIIADASGTLDRVVALDSTRGVVRLRMSRGYFDDRHAWYISTEASDAAVASFERATYAPSLNAAPEPGISSNLSARSGILSIMNGVRERGSAERQGMQSALLNDLAPLNILQHAPSRDFADDAYSPLWDLHFMRWTASAIETNQREKVFSWDEGVALARRGLLVNATSSVRPDSSRTLRAAGVAINCPVMITLPR
jgi:hypothetical protein